MKSKQRKYNRYKAFIAATAVVVLAIGTLVFEQAAVSSASLYVEMVDRKEWRLQAELNAESCASLVLIMAAKDYFLEGETRIDSFGCTAYVTRNHGARTATVSARARFSGVSSGQIVKTAIVE